MTDSVQQRHGIRSVGASVRGTELTRTEVQDVQLRLLDTFQRVCAERGLRYYAYYGTLIGAVRHKGFIPWDDDIDLAVPRADYDLLSSIDWAQYDVEFRSPGGERDYPFMNGKIADLRTLLVENVDHAPEDLGVNIDIFPIDTVSRSGLRTVFEQKELALLSLLRSLKVVKVHTGRAAAKNLALRAAKTLLAPVSIGTFSRRIDAVAAGGRVTGDRVGSRVGPYGDREILPSQFFDGIAEVEFEGRLLPAPSGFHEILTRIYGDYMTPPPPDKRITHHAFTARWR